MTYKYYSTQRPVMPGGFPKGKLVVKIENFDDRKYVEEINKNAWGYIEYSEPLSGREAEDYELVPVPHLESELLPCPFCGKLDSVVVYEDVPHLFVVACKGMKGGCGAHSVFSEKRQTAIVSWNRRAANKGIGDCRLKSNNLNAELTFCVNNGGVLHFQQQKQDGSVSVNITDSSGSEERCTIAPGDMVMLMNYYIDCKEKGKEIL